MKDRLTIGLFSVLMMVVTLASGQDTIITIDGEEISANVVEVRLNEVAYKKQNNPTGPLYIIPHQQVYMIKYANGTKEVFSYEVSSPSQPADRPADHISMSPENLYLQGRRDADIYYRKRGSMWGTFGATVVFAPVGLATGIILGIVPPKIEDTVPDYQMLQSYEYKQGYIKKARGKKWGSVALGFGLGIATNIIVYSLVNNQ